MRRLDQHSTDDQQYSNLLPIVALLVRLGNATEDGGFVMSPDGWRCRLRDPLDFDAVSGEFEIPASIKMSEGQDTILDTLSWCSIEGPQAHPT
jgi:hypothetical protein